MTVSATGSEPIAHSSDTDFGAEKVRSNALTDRARPDNSGAPVTGRLPSISERRSSASTMPSNPSSRDQPPPQTPGASPTPA